MVKNEKNNAGKESKASEKDERLAEALRANLRRRKQQAREQKDTQQKL